MATQGRMYKPTEADRLFVERAIMAGSRIVDIAEALNIHDDTLRKHYRYEIMTARERLKGEAVRVLMDSLTDGSLDAAKFVLARQAGWVEKQAIDHSSSDGSMTPGKSLDVSKLSDAALAEMLAVADGQKEEPTGG